VVTSLFYTASAASPATAIDTSVNCVTITASTAIVKLVRLTTPFLFVGSIHGVCRSH